MVYLMSLTMDLSGEYQEALEKSKGTARELLSIDRKRAADQYRKCANLEREIAKNWERFSSGRERRRKNAEIYEQYAEVLESGGKLPFEVVKKPPRREYEPVEAEEEELTEWLPVEPPKVSFDDVGGLEDVKNDIRNMLIIPAMHPEEAKRYKLSTSRGVLLYGPPGTGKTFIGKATAHETKALFFHLESDKIISKWAGESEKNIDRVFAEARKAERAMVFVDEVSEIFPSRDLEDSSFMRRIVSKVLDELDGVEGKGENLLFMGATNRPWAVDRALLRPGRFDRQIYVPPPDFDARKRIFELNLEGRPCEPNLSYEKFAEITEQYSGADIREICNVAANDAFMAKITQKKKGDVLIGDELVISAIKKVKPSISKDDLAKFEKYRKMWDSS